MNEPRPGNTECEWSYIKGNKICEEATSSINEYNKICLKAIRETGGNNEKDLFWLLVWGPNISLLSILTLFFQGTRNIIQQIIKLC